MALPSKLIRDCFVDEPFIIEFLKHSSERERMTPQGVPKPGTRIGSVCSGFAASCLHFLFSLSTPSHLVRALTVCILPGAAAEAVLRGSAISAPADLLRPRVQRSERSATSRKPPADTVPQGVDAQGSRESENVCLRSSLARPTKGH